MFNVNKNYAEIALRQTQTSYVPAWYSRAKAFKSTITKLCPRCGTFLSLTAKGCDNCLFQFNKESKNVNRLGTRRIES